jgi:exopolyphosphatase/guanosine-5'-triphosphate,3'-diphosphate pyrophosphatase
LSAQTKTDSTLPNPAAQDAEPPKPYAVIDIGATLLRMQISEIHADGSIRRLDSFSQAISIGNNSFSRGRIEKSTIEDCVRVLRIYRAKLTEYGIVDDRQIRVVATSAVKEAQNRLAFLDRIYIATGFAVETLDEAELHRVTYVSALPLIQQFPDTFSAPSVICEVSGGTTELLFFDTNEVMYSQSYRQGSIRIRKSLEGLGGPPGALRSGIEAQLSRMIGQIKREAEKYEFKNMIAIGGDIRFAANQILGENKREAVSQIQLPQLDEFADHILSQSAQKLVAKYHLSLPEADSLGPALAAYYRIAHQLGIETLFVAGFNLRDGMIAEMAQGGKWSQAVERQMIRSAIRMGRKFKFDQDHAIHVSRLAVDIFRQLQAVHQLEQRYQVILEMAAILHEIGSIVSTRSYHKHSMYLIRYAEFFGISAKDVDLVALVARYHRRATPQPMHEGYSDLDRRERVSVAKLAAILRIAKGLDVNRNQRVKQIRCEVFGPRIVIHVQGPADLSVEKLELTKTSQMFSDIFGTKVQLELGDGAQT